MYPFLWLGIVLLVAWLVVWLVVGVSTFAVHLLAVTGTVFIAWSRIQRRARRL